jgi:epoxyqueuosine reductase
MTEPVEAEIMEFLNNDGITLAGIASVCHLPAVPEEFSPYTLCGNARSIICYGVPIPKGIIHADTNARAVYWRYCNMTYRTLDAVSNKLSLFLEEKSCFATPVYGCYPWKVVNRKFWGLLPLVYWAEQAGLGTLTKSGLLGTPDYGTRILLGGVLTTMTLQSTKKVNDTLCPPDCFKCISACPAHAIEKTGKVDHNRCIRYAHENPLLSNLLKERKYSLEMLMNTVGVDDHSTYRCFECIRVCPLNR